MLCCGDVCQQSVYRLVRAVQRTMQRMMVRSVFLVNREPFHRFHCHISILVVNPHLVEVIIVCPIFNPVHKRVHGNAGAHDVLVCGLVTSALRTYDLTIV